MLRICMKNAEPGAIYWPNLDLCLHLPTHNSQGVGLRWSAIMFTHVADFDFHKHYILPINCLCFKCSSCFKICLVYCLDASSLLVGMSYKIVLVLKLDYISSEKLSLHILLIWKFSELNKSMIVKDQLMKKKVTSFKSI